MAKKEPLAFEQFGDALPGEDRAFGGNGFYVDLVPSGAWFTNLRAAMPLAQWKALSAYVRYRSQNRCEMCGSDLRLEAHERWQFDADARTQKLMRIMCLCKNCHLSVHIGVASKMGIRQEIEAHILSITGWSKDEFSKHVKEAREQWGALIGKSWKMDLSLAENAGITLLDPGKIQENIATKRAALAKEISQSELNNVDDEGFNCPLDHLLREGYVAFLPKNEMDTLGSFPLAEMTPGLAKHPSEVGADYVQTSLQKYIMGYNNPVVVKSKKLVVDNLLADPEKPRRLLVNSSWVEKKLVQECFKRGILFTFESAQDYWG